LGLIEHCLWVEEYGCVLLGLIGEWGADGVEIGVGEGHV